MTVIRIRAFPNSSKEKIEKIDEENYLVCVKEPPTKGIANQRIRLILSRYFGVTPENVRIISGIRSRRKKIEINGL